MEDDDKAELSRKLIEVIGEISQFSDYRTTVKKQYTNLARRLKLLTPLFEEIRDSKEPIPEDSIRALAALAKALESAKELLRFGSKGSKIYLVLEREQIMNKFQEVTAELEQVLSGISFEKLDISDELKEHVELVLAQFRRAKGRVDAADAELYEDLVCLYNKNNDAVQDPDVLKRMVHKLQLGGIADLTQESLALHEMVGAAGGDPGESIEKMSMLLKQVKDFVLTVNPDIDSTATENSAPPTSGGKTLTEASQKNLVIPDDFRCPISLELMQDPVIVSTGQTYERACIEKWLEVGHGTCPKTRQALTSIALMPNYVLRSLTTQWCEANGIEPPERPGNSQNVKPRCIPSHVLRGASTSSTLQDDTAPLRRHRHQEEGSSNTTREDRDDSLRTDIAALRRNFDSFRDNFEPFRDNFERECGLIKTQLECISQKMTRMTQQNADMLRYMQQWGPPPQPQ